AGHSSANVADQPTVHRDLGEALPAITRLSAPYPNPTRRGVGLDLEVSVNGRGRYLAEVFNVRGQRVAVLANEVMDAGRYRVTWSGLTGDGREALPGVYFVRVAGPAFRRNSKLVVLR
ncbi:T9SS type A sorting domain-containing protein, partial [bacterium]|nr:T9SS type A sorting domain-containing protein [bacterium]